jgi:tetratricopeptide (TPR) repeat protein
MKSLVTKITYIFLFFLFLLLQNTIAQNKDPYEIIRTGKSILDIAIDKYDTSLFLKAHSVFEQALQSGQAESLSTYYKCYTEYCLLTYELNNPKSNYFSRFYDSSVSRVKQNLDSHGLESEMRTLLAAIYMMEMAKYPAEAPLLFMKINGLLGESKALNPSNPRTFYISGIMKAKTPGMFGGSTQEAIKILKTAASLFENSDDTNKLKPDWGYPETLAWLGNLLMDEKHFDDSEFFLRKALDIRPNYGWIKFVLLPKLTKLRNNN